MKVLVLDDNEILRYAPEDYMVDAHDYRNDEFTQTVNINKFVDFFFHKVWDEVWIDHDLGHPTNNGRTATKKIYEKFLGDGWKMQSEPLIRITTMNDAVAKILMSDLQQCGFNVIRFPISSLGAYGIVRGKTLNVFDQ